ncbi:MAG TPA: STAS domain-containing protein [Actinomycetota bacterium]|nr:STAS domain-containing protein [Actinomycetota bacterium]
MRTDQALTTRIDARNGVTSIALSGELDMATVPILNDQLTALERDGTGAIMLDLRELSFIDSSGLHAFIEAHKRSLLNGHRFLLVGASPIARRLCEMTRTEFLLDAQGTPQLLDRFTGDAARTGGRDRVSGPEPHV